MAKLSIRYKKLDWAVDKRYEKNERLHDIGLIYQSIQRHGFRQPVIWDATLKGIVAGNGRIETLYHMYNDHQSGALKEIPLGIEVDKDSMWKIPIVYGISAESMEEAVGFLIDDNNAGLMGGDVSVVDAAFKNWGTGYLDLLKLAIGHTVSVDEDDLLVLQRLAESEDDPLDLSDVEAFDEEPDENVWLMRIPFTSKEDRDTARAILSAQEDQGAFIMELLDNA